MKVLFYDIDSFDKSYLTEKITKNIEPYFFDFPLNKHVKIIPKYSDSMAICAFIHSNLNRAILSEFKNLKYIFLRSTGYSNVDIEYCKERNIEVYNVPLYADFTIAEYVFSLIFSLLRKIPQAKESIKNADILREKIMGTELQGKTLGIIGVGNIGSKIADIAKCFNLNTLAYDINQNNPNIKYTDLKTILKNSDIVSLTCPLNSSTKKLINFETISYMKKDSFIINVARGEVIDTEALYLALFDKKIKGAALDTVECEEELCALYKECSVNDDLREKCIKKFLFIKKLALMDNVIITPHNGYNTVEARYRMLASTMDNINSVIKNNNSGTKICF